MEYTNGSGRRVQSAPRKQTASKKPVRQLTILVVVIVLVGAAFFLKSGIGSDELKGTWAVDEITAYRFDGDGKGCMLLPEQELDFSYECEHGVLSIDYENEAVQDRKFRYHVNQNKLILEDGEGDELARFEFTRKD